MQTELKRLEGLKCELKTTIPVETVKSIYKKNLINFSKKVKLPGFRPGKVPLYVVEKKYSTSLKSEVAGEIMQTSFKEALEKHQLRIVGTPEVKPGIIDAVEPFVYFASFEVYPEFELKDLSGVKVEKLTSEVTDNDITKMTDKILRQKAEWIDVKREAKEGDRLLIDFQCKIDEQTFEDGNLKDFPIELGSKNMIPGFEEGLVGTRLNQQIKLEVTFPQDYPQKNLAGKEAIFVVDVNQIKEPKIPELNDKFFRSLGMQGGIDNFKTEVRQRMDYELEQAVNDRMKITVLDKLIELNPIEIPEALVNIEVKNLKNITSRNMIDHNSKDYSEKMDLPPELYLGQARKRVLLGILIGKLIEVYGIKLDSAKVRERIEKISRTYRKSHELANLHYNNKQLLSEVEALVLEEQAVALLLEKAEVIEKSVEYNDIFSSKLENTIKI